MKPYLWLGLLGMFSVGVQAASLDVPINLVSADGAPKPIGNVSVSETEYGLVFTPTSRTYRQAFMVFTFMKTAAAMQAPRMV